MVIELPGWQVRGWTAPLATSTKDYQVLVVGGGLSGCAAAVAAARRGIRTVLLEPTHQLGGQMTVGGVGTVDLSPFFGTVHEQGLWKDFAQRVRAIYAALGLTTAVARYRVHDSMAVNSPVVDRVLTELCQEAGVEVVRNCPVTAAEVTGTDVTLTTALGVVTGDVVVEATEDGGLLELADQPYRIGKLTGKGTLVNGNPADVRIQSLTQCAVLRRYDNGIPDEFRMTASDKPAGYDAVRDAVAAEFPGRPYGTNTTSNQNDFAGFRAYPDIALNQRYTGLQVDRITRTSINQYVNDVDLRATFLTDPAVRAERITRGINLSLAIIYYLQVELGLNWAVADDEGFAEGPALRTEGITPDMPDWVKHFPVIPYQRESRRLIGAYTLTGRRIKRPAMDRPCVWSSQNVAVGTYATDMHSSLAPEDYEAYLGESTADRSERRGPFVLPFGSFVPADGARLVAAEKNLSMTRLASSAMRVHPSVVAAGEAAGVIAALSARTKVSPGSVSYRATQVSLLRGGALLLPYPIDKVSAKHPEYAAISLALLNNRVPFTLDHQAKLIRLTSTRMATAKTIGRRLLAAWAGPL